MLTHGHSSVGPGLSWTHTKYNNVHYAPKGKEQYRCSGTSHSNSVHCSALSSPDTIIYQLLGEVLSTLTRQLS